MAAPSGTVWGSIVNGSSSGRKGRLGIYVNVSNTATKTTVKTEVWFWTIYSCSDTSNNYYYSAGKGVTSATGSYGSCNIKHTVASGSGSSTSNQTRLHQTEHTYDRSTSAVTHNVYAKLVGIDILNDTVYANTSYTIPALASYKVTYNANGGSGAPYAQTKWHGKSLTLSTTKPTRTGYSFLGWSTSSTATSAGVQPGATYTNDASVTYYAVWKANTYTVSYNANGGSGAPSNQTKTHDKTLTLSSTTPTRTNYNFKGWGTSKSATTVTYNAGASYTNNASITLYAIWELAYSKPRITNFSVTRCTSDGTANDEGTYARVKFGWSCDNAVRMISVDYKLSSSTAWNIGQMTTSSGGASSGTYDNVIGSGDLSADSTYDVRVAVSDGSGDAYKTTTTVILEGTKFLIDLKADGKGIAFGKPAELSSYMDVGFDMLLRKKLILDANQCIYARSPNNVDMHLMYLDSTDTLVIGADHYNKDLNTYVYGNDVRLRAKGVIQSTAPVQIAVTTDASGTADNKPALHIGAQTGVHLELDGNEIMSKLSLTETGPLYINSDGGNVRLNDAAIGSTFVRGCRIAENKVLWSGVYYMADSQTATLNEAISKQANGIVVIWSWYENGESDNSVFNSFFIPKHFVSAHNGKGMAMGLWSATANTFASKYLYVSDTSIAGYVNNDIEPWTTGSGIKSTPKSFVLRYVIGV